MLARHCSGSIAWSFDSTLYLRTADGLYCLVSTHLPRGPLNINTSVTRFSEIPINRPWRLESTQLIVDEYYIFDTANAKLWSPPVPITTHPSLSDLDNLSFTDDTKNPPETRGAASDLISERLFTGMSACKQWLRKPGSPVLDDIKLLVGCGEGLTPAGDDYLSGVVITLHFLQRHTEQSTLQQWVKENVPGNTSDISLAHLLAACDGHANEPVHALLSSICTQSTREHLEVRCRDVLNIGHTSGWFILRGIKDVLAVVQPDG